MSNLIKYPFVNLAGKEAMLIEYEKEEEPFVPLKNSQRVKVRPVAEVEAEKAAREAKEEAAATESEFEPGVPVVNFDEMLAEKKEEAEHLAEQVLSEAKEKAAILLQEADEKVEEIRQAAHDEGMTAGREEGLAKAEEELAQTRMELEEARQQQEKDYHQLIADVEPRYVEVLCSLVQKLTGVLLSDKQDVLLHLIRNSVADIEPSRRYVIRVSPEDVMYVESHREEILVKLGAEAVVEVQEEKNLAKDECIIETDTQMIDCGFQTQLDNLVSTLRMLAQ
ncbi:MAG: hypothetical protein J1F02_03130 [Lachnospiraceae bacterium]|nr:hypothetical protein [Lachnospiraceae bacterium]